MNSTKKSFRRRRAARVATPLATTLVVGAALIHLQAGCSSSEGGCTKDNDCATGRICAVSGECVDLGPSTSSSTGTVASSASGATSGGGSTTTVGTATTTAGAGGASSASVTSSTGSGVMCSGGLTACGGACVNLAADPQNCGSCGKLCGAGESCTGSACVAPTPTSCKALLTAKPGTPNGLYLVDPDGVGGQPATKLFCDMTSGGLTLVANIFDSPGDDAPNATSYVESGWQQKGSGQWDTSAAMVDRDASGSGSASVSLAFVAALKSAAAQQNLKICLVSNSGDEPECRASQNGTLALVSGAVGNPKLQPYANDPLTFTFGRLAGLANSIDGYVSANFATGDDPKKKPYITIAKGTNKDGKFGGAGILFEDGYQNGDDSVWVGRDGGIAYAPWDTTDRELRSFYGNNPSLMSYGFRLYVGP